MWWFHNSYYKINSIFFQLKTLVVSIVFVILGYIFLNQQDQLLNQLNLKNNYLDLLLVILNLLNQLEIMKIFKIWEDQKEFKIFFLIFSQFSEIYSSIFKLFQIELKQLPLEQRYWLDGIDKKWSKGSDIWSFGMVFCEIMISRQVPYRF